MLAGATFPNAIMLLTGVAFIIIGVVFLYFGSSVAWYEGVLIAFYQKQNELWNDLKYFQFLEELKTERLKTKFEGGGRLVLDDQEYKTGFEVDVESIRAQVQKRIAEKESEINKLTKKEPRKNFAYKLARFFIRREVDYQEIARQ